MESITTKQFSMLGEHMAVYQFMLEIYQRDWGNGVPAPFWEYALCSGWMDKSFLHRCGMWLDGEKIVGFCFHENPVTDVYFSLRPGYEALAPEMVAYGGEHMPRQNGEHRLVIFGSQTAIRQAAAALSELYRRLGPLGATHMTGGGNPFYQKIGYGAGVQWTYWRK